MDSVSGSVDSSFCGVAFLTVEKHSLQAVIQSPSVKWANNTSEAELQGLIEDLWIFIGLPLSRKDFKTVLGQLRGSENESGFGHPKGEVSVLIQGQSLHLIQGTDG